MKDRSVTLARFLRLLSHPDRIRIVERLQHEEKDVTSLAESLELPQARTSQHLALLRSHEIVRERRLGRRVLYRLRDKALSHWALQGLEIAEASGDSATAAASWPPIEVANGSGGRSR